MKNRIRLILTFGLVISTIVGILHFFVPYAFAWYSYIPNAPQEILVSIDYINFFFSLMLTGVSLLLLRFRQRIFEGSPEMISFYFFFVFTWFCRVVITIFIPWPSALQTWLMVGFSTEFMITLIPAISLTNAKRFRTLRIRR